MNTSNIQIHTEKFSLKTNWKLTEGSYTAKAIRKIHMKLGRKGRKVIRSEPVPPGKVFRRRLQVWTPALGSEQFKPQIGFPSPGVYTEETSPFSLL